LLVEGTAKGTNLHSLAASAYVALARYAVNSARACSMSSGSACA
jgi:hypothetical protein